MSRTDDALEPRKHPRVARVYRGERIEVLWEPRLCVHEAECFRGSPEAFDPWSRPWVRPDATDPDTLAEVVMRCPAGALHFRRLDGGPQEPASDEVSGRATTNGPLHVRGKVTIVDQAGHVVREDTRMALCRCGASANKPFCDGSHARVRFRDRNEPV